MTGPCSDQWLAPRLRGLFLALLATLPAACTNLPAPSTRPAAPAERIAIAFALWQPQAEESFAAGPGYSLTELDGMNAAMAMGAEGRDAAALWDDERKRHYRARRRPLLAGLQAELRVLGPDRIEQVIAAFTPRAAADPEQAQAQRNARIQYSIFNTFTYRWVTGEVTCASLTSTPRAWRERYPTRAPFAFERFGIDASRLAQWCEVIACEAIEMPQIWRALYQTRVPVGFRRFGTDEAGLTRWCEARHRRSG